MCCFRVERCDDDESLLGVQVRLEPRLRSKLEVVGSGLRPSGSHTQPSSKRARMSTPSAPSATSTAPSRTTAQASSGLGRSAAGSAAAGAAAAAAAEPPSFKPLAELEKLEPGTRLACVFGVVTYFKPLEKTRGTDFVLGLTLTDDSLPPASEGLKCHLFFRDPQKAPQIQRVGDIVRLHRVKVGRYDGQLQLQSENSCSVTGICFSSDASAALVHRGALGGGGFSRGLRSVIHSSLQWHAMAPLQSETAPSTTR